VFNYRFNASLYMKAVLFLTGDGHTYANTKHLVCVTQDVAKFDKTEINRVMLGGVLV